MVRLSSSMQPVPSATLALSLPSYSASTLTSTVQDLLRRTLLVFLNQPPAETSRVLLSRLTGASAPAEITAKILAKTTADVASFAALLKAPAALASVFEAQGGAGSVSLSSWSVTSPGSRAVRDMPCANHYDCQDQHFCSTWPVYGMTSCQPCAQCAEPIYDSFDQTCPQEKCPGTGEVPRCVDSSKLGNTCQDRFPFEVWAHGNKADGPPNIVDTSRTRVRTMTPNNRVIGAVQLTMRRRVIEACPRPVHYELQRYWNASSQECRGAMADSEPFGADAGLLRVSSFFDGKTAPSSYFNASEIKDGTPLGFFPHEYDGVAREIKDPSLIHPGEAGKFLIFFDQRVSGAQAQKMLAYLKDCKFLSESTQEVVVSFVTYNAAHRIFAWVEITFTWDAGGQIKYDYYSQSIDIDRQKDGSDFALIKLIEVMCMIALAINMVLELSDLLSEIKNFRLFTYLLSPFNWIDWLFFIAQSTAWFLWTQIATQTMSFRIEDDYPILANPAADVRSQPHFLDNPIHGLDYSPIYGHAPNLKPETRYRPFVTNAEAEFNFLAFKAELQVAADRLTYYSMASAVTVILFVMRILKGFDFQPRLGLVTRTIAAASSVTPEPYPGTGSA